MYEAYYEKHSNAHSVDQDESHLLAWSEKTKNGVFSLKDSLSAIELAQMIELYDSQNQVSIEQHPHWDDLVNQNGTVKYFTYTKNHKLLAYAIIRFPNLREAVIAFGPVAEDKHAAIVTLRMLHRSMKEATNAWQLMLQLPWQSGPKSEFVETKIRKDFAVKVFNDKRNWSSSQIDTAISNEELAKKFSKNHKRSLKKALKLGLTTRVLQTDDEIERFNDIYVRMYASRGRSIDEAANLEEYKKMLGFFRHTGNGFFLGVFREEQMLGGMIIIKQADSGFYYHSASDPDSRKLPIQHIGVLNILDELRTRNIRFFDFGGYNHMVDKTDQVYNINRFKDGFTKNYIFYPKVMYFEFVPHSVKILGLFQGFKDLVKKVIGR